eukprot:COSAG02_NODE_7989_length_2756_cov_6.974784_1_plen_33_part_00
MCSDDANMPAEHNAVKKYAVGQCIWGGIVRDR